MEVKKTVVDAAVSAAKSTLGQPLPDRNISAYLVLNGKEYELRSFETEFRQEVDHKGKPQHEVRGGLIAIMPYSVPDTQLNEWMMKAFQKHSGSIEFRLERSSSPLRILFTDAYCVSYMKEVGNKEQGVITKLIISPAQVAFNDELIHSNRWVK